MHRPSISHWLLTVLLPCGVAAMPLASLATAQMQIVTAQHIDWLAPALRHKTSVITKVVVEATGDTEPLSVTKLKVQFAADCKLTAIQTVHALGQPLGAARELVFAGRQQLAPGKNELTLAVDLTEQADLGERITATITAVTFSDGTTLQPSGQGSAQRIGVALRTAGQDNCHTYRIPGLATSNQGTLIAVYDNRYRASGDLPGDIDVGMSRSTDGGSTWQAMRVIMDMGNDAAWQYDGVGDPAVLVDTVTGRIWVAGIWSHGNRSWHGSGAGLAADETGQLLLVHSDDDGITWSKPENITAQIKDPKWRFVLQGPGRGITMRDGTLVFAAQYRSATDGPHQGHPFATMLSSRDRGKTWQIGTGVKVDTTEAQLVELTDGVLMINCRDDRGGSRSIYTTSDLGKNWSLHATSRQALIEPVCMASLLRVDHKQFGTLLLFSNPHTTSGRSNMTMQVSSDLGASWPEKWHARYDQRAGYGYSCLTRIDSEHVGVVYEGVRELYFLRFSIRELLAQ